MEGSKSERARARRSQTVRQAARQARKADRLAGSQCTSQDHQIRSAYRLRDLSRQAVRKAQPAKPGGPTYYRRAATTRSIYYENRLYYRDLQHHSRFLTLPSSVFLPLSFYYTLCVCLLFLNACPVKARRPRQTSETRAQPARHVQLELKGSGRRSSRCHGADPALDFPRYHRRELPSEPRGWKSLVRVPLARQRSRVQ